MACSADPQPWARHVRRRRRADARGSRLPTRSQTVRLVPRRVRGANAGQRGFGLFPVCSPGFVLVRSKVPQTCGCSGGRYWVWPIDDVIHELEAAGAIMQGGGVQAAANGQVDSAPTSIAAASAAGCDSSRHGRATRPVPLAPSNPADRCVLHAAKRLTQRPLLLPQRDRQLVAKSPLVSWPGTYRYADADCPAWRDSRIKT